MGWRAKRQISSIGSGTHQQQHTKPHLISLDTRPMSLDISLGPILRERCGLCCEASSRLVSSLSASRYRTWWTFCR